MTSGIRMIAVFPLMGLVSAAETDWRTLFNGTDLGGWTKTIAGRPVGEDPDGLLRLIQMVDRKSPRHSIGSVFSAGINPVRSVHAG